MTTGCVYPKTYFHYGDIGSIEEEICIAVALQNGVMLEHRRRHEQFGDALCKGKTIEIRYSSLRKPGNQWEGWAWSFITKRRKLSRADFYILVAGGMKNRYFIMPRDEAEYMLGDRNEIRVSRPREMKKRRNPSVNFSALSPYENRWDYLVGNG
jgi:hypothetical protein